MRRIFVMLFVVALQSLPLSGAQVKDVAMQNALSELSRTRAESESFQKEASAERARLESRLEILSSESKKLSEELSQLLAENDKLRAQSSERKFYSEISSEIFLNAMNFERAFLGGGDFVRWKTDIADTADYALSVLDRAAERTFEPLKAYSGKAVSESGAELDGKIFRLGKNRYFVSDTDVGFIDRKGEIFGTERASEISDFYNGKSDILPLAPLSVPQGGLKSAGVFERIKLGGIWMWPILGFGAMSLLVFAVKIFSLVRIRRANLEGVNAIFASLKNGDEPAAERIAVGEGAPYSELLLGLLRARKLGNATLEEISYEYMLSAGEKLFYGMGVLSVTSAVAPLFGLLGTVTGIIKTFADISLRGAGEPNLIGEGISEALITTEYGLIVAIPAFVAHALLSRRARAIMGDMERLSSTFIGKNTE